MIHHSRCKGTSLVRFVLLVSVVVLGVDLALVSTAWAQLPAVYLYVETGDLKDDIADKELKIALKHELELKCLERFSKAFPFLEWKKEPAPARWPAIRFSLRDQGNFPSREIVVECEIAFGADLTTKPFDDPGILFAHNNERAPPPERNSLKKEKADTNRWTAYLNSVLEGRRQDVWVRDLIKKIPIANNLEIDDKGRELVELPVPRNKLMADAGTGFLAAFSRSGDPPIPQELKLSFSYPAAGEATDSLQTCRVEDMPWANARDAITKRVNDPKHIRIFVHTYVRGVIDSISRSP